MLFPPAIFATNSLRSSPMGDAICQVLSATMKGIDAGECVKRHISLDNSKLNVSGKSYDLNVYHRVLVVGVGKAVIPMASAAAELLGDYLSGGLIITKDGYRDKNLQTPGKIHVLEATHPIPTQKNLLATQRLISFVGDLTIEDLVICLISGGGSSLLTLPSHGISLTDIQSATSLLLSCGASIDEINTIRKHIDDVKGGGLAKLLYPATVVSLVLSDVIGDHLDMVASGPTVADPTTFHNAWAILEKYQILNQVPVPVLSHLEAGLAGKITETIKPGDKVLEYVDNTLVGNNALAVGAASAAAKSAGFTPMLLTDTMRGEASQVGQELAGQALSHTASMADKHSHLCYIAGGETTVTIKGKGNGGRNQELALGAVDTLSSSPRPAVLVSLATDGGDGPTDAAGAVATNLTYAQGMSLGLAPGTFLQGNDSYHYFDALGDLLKTGPTLTNINDLAMIFVA